MKIKLPEQLKKEALKAVENVLEAQIEANFDKQADELFKALKKLAGSQKLIVAFIESMEDKAKAEARAALLQLVDKVDGIPKDQE